MKVGHIIANRYELGDLIGSGAMGDVYRATDTQTGAIVAVKHLKPDLLRYDAGLLTRFQREGEALRDLNHPNIVSLLDIISEDNGHYLVMEYVAGGDLTGLLGDAPQGMPPEQVLAVALELADALTRAHHLNIIHRDLKPANVLIAADGTPRLSDFSIALHAAGERITESNAIIGTMDYIAPEAISGESVDTRADVWAFGVMLFEMLAGQRPFRGDTLVSLLASILSEPVPDLEAIRPDCPLGLVDLVYRMLVKDPQGRIPSVRLVGAEIESLLKGFDIPDRSHGRGQTADSLFDTPLPDTAQRRRNLPIPSTPFVGRKHELSEIAAQLDTCRLLTLLGPGGMGKTRLSIEAASHLADHYQRGAHFVGLAPIASADQIIPTIAEAVGFQFYQGGEPQQQLLDFLREKEMLLLLDNFEHVLKGAVFVSAMLDHAPQVRVLATSRERLKLSAECVFDVQGLQTPQSEDDVVFEDFEAVEMFVTYARRVQPGYELQDEDKPAVVRICQLVGGMPLGIELAAGWARSLSPQELADELEADLDILSTELADVPERQRSMRAAFEYSWRRLTEDEHDAFMKFSVFRGGATQEAARTVTEASLRVLNSLVDKSMLRRNPSTGRFEVHELMRQFAQDRLEADPQLWSDVHDRHCAFFADHLRQNEIAIKSLDYHDLLADLDNWRAGVNWAIKHARYEDLEWYLILLLEVYYAQAPPTETLAMADHAISLLRNIESPDDELSALLGLALLIKGHGLIWFFTEDDGPPYLEEGLKLARLTKKPRLLAQANMLVANCKYDEPEISIPLVKQTIAIYEEDGDPYEVANALNILGFLVDKQDGARGLKGWEHLERAVALGKAHNIPVAIGHAYMEMGILASNAKNYAQSAAYLRESVEIVSQLSSPYFLEMGYDLLGSTELLAGNYQAAREAQEARLTSARERGMTQNEYMALNWLGYIHEHLGNDASARSAHEEALSIATLLGKPIDRSNSLINLGGLAARANERTEALRLFREALPDANEWSKTKIMCGIARLILSQGNAEYSAELIGLAISRMDPTDKSDFWRPHLIDPVLERLRDQLTADEIEAAFERGQSLDLDTVVQQLLDEDIAS